MNETIKLRVTVRTDRVGSQTETVIDFPREEWEGLSMTERDEALLDSMLELIEWNYEEV